MLDTKTVLICTGYCCVYNMLIQTLFPISTAKVGALNFNFTFILTV